MDTVKRINFILEGREYSANFDADGECVRIYSFDDGRFLRENTDSCERERSHVWAAAYTMLEG